MLLILILLFSICAKTSYRRIKSICWRSDWAVREGYPRSPTQTAIGLGGTSFAGPLITGSEEEATTARKFRVTKIEIILMMKMETAMKRIVNGT